MLDQVSLPCLIVICPHTVVLLISCQVRQNSLVVAKTTYSNQHDALPGSAMDFDLDPHTGQVTNVKVWTSGRVGEGGNCKVTQCAGNANSLPCCQITMRGTVWGGVGCLQESSTPLPSLSLTCSPPSLPAALTALV